MTKETSTEQDVNGISQSSTPPLAVVFDMDGLLFDTERLYFASLTEMLARRGCTFTLELAQQMMGVQSYPALEILRAATGVTEPVEILYLECEALLHSRMETDLQTMPGTWQFIERVEAAGLAKALATSTNRKTTDFMLGKHSMHDRFEFLLTREDVSRGKPAPDIYLMASKRLGLDPSRVLVLEDSRNGALAAKAAGCLTVAIPHDLSRSLDFSFVDLVADSLLDERLLRLAGL